MPLNKIMHIHGTLDQTAKCAQTGERLALTSKGSLYGRTLYGLPSGWVSLELGGEIYYFSSSTNAQKWLEASDNREPVLIVPWERASRAATYTVASSASLDIVKASADYVCDGIADEEEINAAIAACSAYGGTVVLSDNLFYIASPVLIPNRVELVGQGDTNTVLIAAANTNIVEISGTVYNAAIRRIKIDGNNTRGGGAGYSGKGLVLTGGYTITLEDVAVINTAEENIYAASGSVFVFSRVSCSGAGEAGTNVVGVSINQASGPQFRRMTVQQSTGTGILFSGTNDIHCTDVAVDLCCVGTSGYGWVINAGNGHMQGCSVGACGVSGSIAGGGMYIYGQTHDLVIVNFGSRDHYHTGKYSLWIADGTAAMYNIGIFNSEFTGGEGYGAYFGGQINNFNFVGNTVKDNAQGQYAVAADFRGVGHNIRNNPGLPPILEVEDVEVTNSSGANMIPGELVVNGHTTAASYTGESCDKVASQGHPRVLGVVVGRSDEKAYSTGTATTDGTTAVVGVGTAWPASVAGRLIKFTSAGAGDSTWYVVTARADDTHITLDRNFAGSSGTWSYQIGTIAVRPIANGQKGYIRRLGKFGGSSYSTGTVTTTNGGYVLAGSGTTWTVAMVGSVFQDTADASAWYTIVGFNSTTELIIEPAYASAGGAGHNYVINKGMRVEGTLDIDIQDLVGTYGTTAGLGMEAASGDVANAIALEAYATNDENGIIDVLMIPPVQVK